MKGATMPVCVHCHQDKTIALFYNSPYGDYKNTCNKCVSLLITTRLMQTQTYTPPDDTKYPSMRYRYGLNREFMNLAHKIVSKLIKKGMLIVQPCKICGDADLVHSHHCDYLDPVNIHWLCPKHHFAWHTYRLELTDNPNHPNHPI